MQLFAEASVHVHRLQLFWAQLVNATCFSAPVPNTTESISGQAFNSVIREASKKGNPAHAPFKGGRYLALYIAQYPLKGPSNITFKPFKTLHLCKWLIVSFRDLLNKKLYRSAHQQQSRLQHCLKMHRTMCLHHSDSPTPM
eukprot:306178-Pelagomonas_calceolata.AAC.4